VSLATQILIWVGVTTTAGTGLWPLDSWAYRRGVTTGDWPASDPPIVEREIEGVLNAMRRRSEWYADYVETPLGRKRAPVVTVLTKDGRYAEPPTLSLVDEHALDDEHLAALATDAIAAMQARIGRGEDGRAVVVDVIRTVFCADLGTRDLDRAPHVATNDDESVLALLDDPEQARRVVNTVLAIIAE